MLWRQSRFAQPGAQGGIGIAHQLRGRKSQIDIEVLFHDSD